MQIAIIPSDVWVDMKASDNPVDMAGTLQTFSAALFGMRAHHTFYYNLQSMRVAKHTCINVEGCARKEVK